MGYIESFLDNDQWHQSCKASIQGLDKDSARLVESYVIKTKHTYLPEYGYNTNNTTYSKINDDICPEYLNIEVDNKGVAIVN